MKLPSFIISDKSNPQEINITSKMPCNANSYSSCDIPQNQEYSSLQKSQSYFANENLPSNSIHQEGSFNKAFSPPPISSPVFASAKLTEEQVVNDDGFNESYEKAKIIYKQNCNIIQFALDAAAITGRTEDTAKSWMKALKDEDFEAVFDLKLIVYEDWEKLPLTVFSCRAMQNMIYGINSIPLKEKQLAINPKLKDYDNKLPIKEFLEDICLQINRSDMVSHWENQLMAQDIRTVGELKSLHLDDWNRLGLSVFAYRILKNVIFRKGKIVME